MQLLADHGACVRVEVCYDKKSGITRVCRNSIKKEVDTGTGSGLWRLKNTEE
jgi:hypothetical protein